ncbi:hypothetical protein G7072_17875 [Nocardioides sp. HDW12B]|uniref:DUF6624 domain-containing protein n=1 Tax=Nocardioides sp. HDW12B TaxID=2714939 RepID=UPI00140D10E2|nr:DUF6624 domain-containing protein [Nocardioides sp. HDW12B]QIK67962.1 hypothetical protein G7072_17875 [Nocardioides sp. HDW12B]
MPRPLASLAVVITAVAATALTACGDDASRAPARQTADSASTAGTADEDLRRELLDEHGWPGWDLVGRKASTAAWVVAQHADLDLALQRRALTLLETAVAAEDASPGDLAYLTDRVLVAEGDPREYGTQWELDPRDGWRPRTPIADRSSVDERRADAGLDPLRVYLKELEAAG